MFFMMFANKCLIKSIVPHRQKSPNLDSDWPITVSNAILSPDWMEVGDRSSGSQSTPSIVLNGSISFLKDLQKR